jgi:hypothetical protein
MTPDEMPACRCTAHPAGDDRKKYMVIAECTSDFVVFCCKRCSEITKVAVIQVQTFGNLKKKAQYEAMQKRQRMDPELLRMIMARRRGRVRYRREDDADK